MKAIAAMVATILMALLVLVPVAPAFSQADAPRALPLSPSELHELSLHPQLPTLPAFLVPNRGQWADGRVRFALQGPNANVFLMDSGFVLQLFGPVDSNVEPAAVRVHFINSHVVSPEPASQPEASFNYFVGPESDWRSNLPGFRAVAYRGLYDGVDLLVESTSAGLKLEFRLSPGADWRQIAMAYQDADILKVDAAGRLHVSASLGEIIDQAPVIYQESAAGRRDIEGGFELIGPTSVGFRISEPVDPSLPLVIDPALVCLTYLDGKLEGSGSGVALDSWGNVYVAGWTRSTDFPIAEVQPEPETKPAPTAEPRPSKPKLKGAVDAFVAKLTPDCRKLLWSTYVGGSGLDRANGIAIGWEDRVYLTGETQSPDLPQPTGAYNGGSDVFVIALSSDGQHQWSSYLGGTGNDIGYAIAIVGSIYVTGQTFSTDLPRTAGRDGTLSGPSDAFVGCLTENGALDWCTYLGGNADDIGHAIAADMTGKILVAGETKSNADFPTLNGFDVSFNGGDSDAFISCVTSSGTLSWSTYLGGEGPDKAYGVALGAAGEVWVTGATGSSGVGAFPTMGNAFSSHLAGKSDAFVAAFSMVGQLAWATYLGGAMDDEGMAVAPDAMGNLYVTGWTRSPGFPVTEAADQKIYKGNGDAFLTKFSAEGAFLWSSFLGGDGSDFARAVTARGNGTVYIAGDTSSRDIATKGALDESYNGGEGDCFVARLDVATVGANPVVEPPSTPSPKQSPSPAPTGTPEPEVSGQPAVPTLELPPPRYPLDTLVAFEDPALHAAVRTTLRVRGETMTYEEVYKLTNLSATMRKIKGLRGLEYCTSLFNLSLRRDELEDIAPIADLTSLRWLYLSYNKIKNIAPLRGLKELEVVDLRYNEISDLTPLLENKGIGSGDRVLLTGNPLDSASAEAQLQTLEGRGVDVQYLSARKREKGNLAPRPQ